jgi:D-alanyl-D-alanine carboxypeptidase/D-alanyl-D-alanine-endopeptidase (penicillin-binding protein 4)
MNLIILIPLLVLSINLPAQISRNFLQKEIDKIISDDFFDQSQIAVEIYDLTEEKSLYQNNNKLLLHPASNMKLLTSAAGLVFLGSDYRFTTSLYYSGVVKGVTLNGDLYITGGLDPGFSIDDLDSLVRVIKSSGIKFITENLYVDLSIKDSLYWGNGWMWDDNPDTDAPYLSALNINYNSIEVLVKGSEIDSHGIVILNPETEYVEIDNHSVTVPSSKPNDLKITRNWVNKKNTIIIDGEVRYGEIIDSSEHKEKLNILDPEKYFLTLFKERLTKEKIYVYGDVGISELPERFVNLGTINRSLDSVIVSMNKESDNLSAEMLLYALALNDSGVPASAENGIEALKSLIDSTGLDPDDYSLADGSGVSRYNLVSAESIIEVLKYMYRRPEFYIFYNSLPIAGIDGTLEKRMLNTKAAENVHAKTGTLSGVSTLAGYVTANNDNLIAFTIMIQNYVEKNSVARNFQDRICELLANYE